MHAIGRTDGMPRRQFVALSGALGAGALLTGRAAARPRRPVRNRPRRAVVLPLPQNPNRPGGAGPCPPTQTQSVCGLPSDTDLLRQDVLYCTQAGLLTAASPPPPTGV